MTPLKRFERWYTPAAWMLSIGVDFRFKAVSIMIGPFGAQWNWNA